MNVFAPEVQHYLVVVVQGEHHQHRQHQHHPPTGGDMAVRLVEGKRLAVVIMAGDPLQVVDTVRLNSDQE